jgi:HD-GYP domain-containing protein (c-di-GMP phosphodiesterase class II)
MDNTDIPDFPFIAEEIWSSIRAIDTALDERDQYTRNHSRRLVIFTSKTAKLCGLDEHDLELLKIAANLHDIGKLGIPDSILLKPAKLEPDEWEIMKTHSAKGERIVRKIKLEGCEEAAKIVRHHHEYFDGNGYPDGLKGEDIPVLSRIISLCDSYDAMTTTRIYSRARSHEKVMEILHEEEGIKSDPYIFRNFLKAVGNGKAV